MPNSNNTVDPALEIVYGLNDKPPLGETLFAALQHLLAIIVGIMTPPLIIANVLGFSSEMKAYLISMALFVSGIATFIQVKRIGPVGSGLLSIQGTSFAFLGAIIFLNRSQNKFVRMSAIVIGLALGYAVAVMLGKVNFARLGDMSWLAVPHPFKYGFFDFSWTAFIPIALLYLITTVESIGDLTATSMVSKQPISGDRYIKTISGGILGDGVNSALAALFNSFPNTTFSQNNGVIQLTGVASRKVGFFIALLLVIVGMFPVAGGIFSIIPNSVLGGATIIMFGTVAAAGIKIIASSVINRRGMLIMAISLGLGLGVVFVPQILGKFPDMI